MNSTLPSKNIVRYLGASLFFVVGFSFANAAELKEARVTQVVKDVKLLPEQAAPRPASVNDPVRDGTAVRTGVQSRSELTFTDQTITRLGANTIFSFKEGTRVMDLGEGALLFQVPKGAGGATIRTAAVTAAITGTTGIGEFHHATASNPHPVIKWLCLEGTIHLYLTNGSGGSVVLHPGQMEVTDGTKLSEPVDFDIAQLIKTSLFFTGFDTPLPSLALIMREIQRQLDSLLAGGPNRILLALNDIADQVDRGITAQNIVNGSPSPTETPTVTPTASPTVTPTVPPTKFGTLVTITSPDPYVIGSDTTITTDPTITTDGMSDLGKIYRDPSQDGNRSTWLFGSTSAFDTACGFEVGLGTDFLNDIAVFKFQNLVLDADPSVLTAGGVNRLGLIGVDSLTTGASGATLTFGGVETLLLATQNGSITLGANYSFEDIERMFAYARGSGANLMIGSDITTSEMLRLFSQGNVTITGALSTTVFTSFSGGDFNLITGSIDSERIDVIAQGDINLSDFVSSKTVTGSNGNVALTGVNIFSDSLDIERTNGGILSGLNVSIQTEGDLSVTHAIQIATDNSSTTLSSGGNILLHIGGDLTCGELKLTAANNNEGHLGFGNSITVQTLGDLTAFSIDALINNSDGGSNRLGFPSLTFQVGALNTSSDANFTISNMNGGTFGGPVLINLEAASMAIGGNLSAQINNDAGGSMQSSTLRAFTNGNLMTTGFLDLEIGNTGFNDSGFVGGGEIGAAEIDLSASSVSSGDFLQAFIFNNGGGQMGGALIHSQVSGNIAAPDSIFFDIQNSADTDGENLVPGGMITGNAAVLIAAGGAISSSGVVEFAVLNNDFRFLGAGGTINGSATVSVSAGSIMAGDFFQPLINNTHGMIGGQATVAVNVAGPTNVGTEGFFRISNDAGTIGEGALFSFTGGIVSIGDTLFAEIENREEGEIGGDAILEFRADDLTATDTANFQILNGLSDSKGSGAGGSIGGDAIIDVQLASLTAPILVADIDNTGGGSIGGDAILSFNVGGGVNTTVAAFAILNNADNVKAPSGSIAGQALISFITSANFTSNTLAALIDNRNGGLIGTAAKILFNIGDTLMTTGDALFQISGGFSAGGTAIDITSDTLSVGGNLNSRIDTDARIANSGNGIIGGDATIDMNISGNATVAADATFEIVGSDGAKTAAININGGNYDVGGTFLSFIDGDGTITFNNASAHADVLKAGVFGANGVLNIGGGTLSADSTLKLYAPGSNGQLNFVSNVTLGGNSAKILAANSITIFNNVVVTIGGTKAADVYTGFTSETPNANYTGFGGNGTTTGTFAGAGANNPQPLENAPPFDDPPRPSATSHPPVSSHPPRKIAHSPNPPVVQGRPPRSIAGPRPGGNNRPQRIVTVRDSDELASLIHRSTQGGDGQNSHRDATRTSDRPNTGGTKVARTLNSIPDRRDVRNGFSPSVNRLP